MLSYPRQQQYCRPVHAGVALTVGTAAPSCSPLSPPQRSLPIAALMFARSGRLRPPSAPLGPARRSRPRRRAIRGPGAARPRPTPGRGLAATPLAGVAGPRRHRQRRDRPEGLAFAIETKTSTYTPQDLARVRDIAAWLRQAAAALVPQWRAARPVRRARSEARARRGRGPRRLARPTPGCVENGVAHPAAPEIPLRAQAERRPNRLTNYRRSARRCIVSPVPAP